MWLYVNACFLVFRKAVCRDKWSIIERKFPRLFLVNKKNNLFGCLNGIKFGHSGLQDAKDSQQLFRLN